MSNLLSRIASLFRSENPVQKLNEKLEALMGDHRQIKQELVEIKSRLHMNRERPKHKGFSREGRSGSRPEGRPSRYSDIVKPGSSITDIHGNVIQVQGGAPSKWGTSPVREIMETKGIATPTLNVRRCRVWGCVGMNEIDGYCQKHYQKLKKVNSNDE